MRTASNLGRVGLALTGERLTNAVVRAGISARVTDNEACGSPVTAAQAAPLGGTIEFECEHPLRARYVSVDIPGSATLQLCEVTVRELPLDQCPGWCISRQSKRNFSYLSSA